jgi:spore germination protein YaaH
MHHGDLHPRHVGVRLSTSLQHWLVRIAALLLGVIVAMPVAGAETTGGIGSSAIGPADGVPVGATASARVPLAAVDKGLQREVFGFFRASYIDHMLERADFSVLSTIAFFSLDAQASGHLRRRAGGVERSGWAVWDGPRMDRLIDRAHAAGTRVVLTITRFAWDDEGYAITSRLLGSATARATLTREIVHEVVRRGVDGVNIDFEPIPSARKDAFVTFIRQLRRALDAARPGYQLTYDSTGYVGNYDVRRLTGPGAADAAFIMGYPYEGPWSDRAGSVAPLAGARYTVRDTVDRYLRLTTADRIILGVPYFGFEWSTVTGAVHSLTRPKGATYGWPLEIPLDRAVATAITHGRRWDDAQKGPWARWQFRNCASCPVTWRQIHYEDQVSLGMKYDLVNDRDLRGAGIWSLGYEGRRTALDEALRDAFSEP